MPRHFDLEDRLRRTMAAARSALPVAAQLSRVGVMLTDAQKLMRHSDPKLTANVYTVRVAEQVRVEPRKPTVSQKVAQNTPEAPDSRRRATRNADASREKGEWLGPESNREPTDYETVALTN